MSVQNVYDSGGSRGGSSGPASPPPWVKKKKSREEEKPAGQAKHPLPSLSSRSGSTTIEKKNG